MISRLDLSSQVAPPWLRKVEKKLGWIAIPNIAMILVTLQALGFLMVTMNPVWWPRLALVPDAVRAGEYWRLVTFLSLPIAQDFLWAIIALWFLYFIANAIESQWGAFRTTLYVLIVWILMIGFSFAMDYPIVDVRPLESTLFLAAACLYPETEILIFFIIPAKLKWLGWVAGVLILWHALQSSWVDRLYLLVVYSGFAVFFGPALTARIKYSLRRKF